MAVTARSSSPVQSGVAIANPYRVAIVEESAVIRGMLSRWLTESGDFEIVARVGDGGGAVSRMSDVGAEVIILNVDAAVLDGVGLLPKLLEKDPARKVLAITSSKSDKVKGTSALRAIGASVVLERPIEMRDFTTSKSFPPVFVKTVKSLGASYRNDNNGPSARRPAAAPAKVKAVSTGKSAAPAAGGGSIELVKFSPIKPEILAIGSSTGGPKALHEVVANIDGLLNVPVVIAQHMPPLFTGILAEHLTKASGMVAKEGEHGEKVLPGHIYVAPGDQHMVLTGTQSDLRIELNQGPEENFCRPSVDPLFRSVAKIFGSKSLCLMLTGMGHDGCSASKDIVNAGGSLIAQDEESSVVWGMPGAVAQAGLCAEILPLSKIGPRVTSLLKGMVK